MELNKDYLSEAENLLNGCIPELQILINNSVKWDDLGQNDRVHIYQIVSPEGRQTVKAIGKINRSTKTICNFLLNSNKKLLWDKMLIESRPVLTFNDQFKVFYERFYAPWPVNHRDFVFAARVYQANDGLLIIAKSFDAGIPAIKGVVRAELLISGIYLKKITKHCTEVTYIVSANPKGKIPKFIVKKFGRKQCENLNRIRDCLKKNI
jgi:hypothetical protein